MSKADSRTQLCGEVGCGRPMRARKLCATHYNQQHQPERHRKVTVPCDWCGNSCEKAPTQSKKYRAAFCSLGCRDAHGLSTGEINDRMAHARSLRGDLKWSPSRRARMRLAIAARGTKGTTWVGGTCLRCGCHFVSRKVNSLGRYCSDECVRRASASRRRARLRAVEHVPYSSKAIFERDGWRCHICKKLTLRTAKVPHPRAPTIDHLIPTTAHGADAPYNVACAHFRCNSKRREVGAAQLLLCG